MGDIIEIRDRKRPPRLRALSLCSGIEAWSEACRQSGLPIDLAAYAEIEPGPCAVLAARHPGVPNLGDMTKGDFVEHAKQLGQIDALVAGPPCQGYSVAGPRGGISSDPRALLSLLTVRYMKELNIPVLIFENVPGLLTMADNSFGHLLADIVGHDAPLEAPKGKWPKYGMACGKDMHVAWRVVDAQEWGVAQRRKRVFLCAARNRYGIDATQVIFDYAPGATEDRTVKIKPTAAFKKADGGWTGLWLPDRKTGRIFSVQPRVFHAGMEPRTGAVKVHLKDVLHQGYVPSMYHLSPKAAFGVASRASRFWRPIDGLLCAAVAETVATGATALMDEVLKSKARERAKDLPVLIGLLDSYLKADYVPSDNDIAVGWSGDHTPKILENGVPCLRAHRAGFGVAYETSGFSVTDVAPCIDTGSKDGPVRNQQAAVIVEAFKENQRNEVRGLGGVASCLDTGGGKRDMLVGVCMSGMGAKARSIAWSTDTSPTLTAGDSGTNRAPTVVIRAFENHAQAGRYDALDGTAPTVNAKYGTGGNAVPLVVEAEAVDAQVDTIDVPWPKTEAQLRRFAALAQETVERRGRRYVLRKLTSHECLRLQGFRDTHMDIEFCRRTKAGKRIATVKPEALPELRRFHHEDSRAYSDDLIMHMLTDAIRYKAAGNSMAVPCMSRWARGIYGQADTLIRYRSHVSATISRAA